MAWATKGTSDALTLDGSYDTILESSSTKTWTLNPGEQATLILDVDFQATPTENADIVILRSVDGTEFETVGEAERYVILAANRETDDPAERHIVVGGCYGFRVQGRVRDTDDTAGGDDTGTTLTVHYRLDGVSL
jgi:hypothetical protein